MLRLTYNFSLKIPEFLKSKNNNVRNSFFVHTEAFSSEAGKNHFMSKLIFVLFIVLLFSTKVSFGQREQLATQARDQITTQAGEKIRCRILDETATRFIYAYVTPTGKVLRNEIFKNLVTDFKYNYYPEEPGAKASGKSKSDKETATKVKTPKTTEADKNTDNKSGNVTKQKPDEKLTEKTQKKPDESITNKEKESSKSINPETKGTPEKQEEKKVAERTETPAEVKRPKGEYDNYLKFRIGVRGGFGNMLAKQNTEDQFGLYQEKLLRGWTWGADMAYFPTDNFGFGIMFNNFLSKNSAENLNFKFRKNGESIDTTGNLANKRSAKFVGPVLYFRKSIDFKTMVILGLAPGAYFYSDKGTYNGVTIPYKGWDFGGAATLGIDFLLGNDITGRDIILSLEAGYNYGKIRSMDFSDGKGAVKLANAIDLSRLDFTVGLRFTRYPRYLRN